MEADQLQGAELDAAVARAMGKQPQLRADTKGAMHCMIPYPQDCAPDAVVAFRSSRGGAAAWEVLEWVLGQGLHVEMWRDRLDGCTVCWIFDRPGDGRLIADGIGPADGPTDAIALCRAVVALGEAG